MTFPSPPVNDALTPAEQRTFVVFTAAKFVGNMGLRLVYPFNTDIAAGLGVSLSTVGAALGAGELTGLASGVVGRDLDRGRFRRWALVACASIAVGGLAMGIGERVIVFAVAFAAVVFGVATITTTAHTWIGAHVPTSKRGRVMGIYETSWAFALLIGAPMAGALIAWLWWWTPFAAVGLAAAVVLGAVVAVVPGRDVSSGRHSPEVPLREALTSFTRRAWLVLLTGIVLTLGAVSSFATFGAWLKDRHGFTTGSVAALTLALGVAELLGSGGVAVFGDRIGPGRAAIAGSGVMALGAVGMVIGLDGPTALAVMSVVVLFLGFEFAFVANLTSVSGAGGAVGGAFVGLNHTLTTACRAAAAAAGTASYERWSMRPVAAFTLAAAVVAIAAAWRADA